MRPSMLVVVPPGQAWPDWMIAGELAVHLGDDFGFDSVGTVWDEIEHLAPSHRGITRAVLDSHGAADGVVAPLSAGKVSLNRRTAPLDPVAAPGVESVERQGASLHAGLASSPNAAADGPDRPADHAGGPARPDVLSGPVGLDVPHVSPADGYSVRLVASRVLYDGGTAVSAVASLAGLVAPGALRANPQDLEALGLPAGGQVRLRSSTASTVVPVEPDASLPRKVVAADFNVPFGDGTVADLIDRAFPVVDLRMETP